MFLSPSLLLLLGAVAVAQDAYSPDGYSPDGYPATTSPATTSPATTSPATTYPATTCRNPRVRKSWHRLSNPEKTEYLRAVKCLFDKPAQGQNFFRATQNRHDDFVSLHVNQTSPPAEIRTAANRGLDGPGIHFNGVFLPWHRYAVWSYENVLIKECGYKGAQPYWDWTLDTPEHNTHFNMSPVFDAQYGFGGNGAGGSTVLNFTNTQNATPPPPAPPSGNCIDSGPFTGSMYSVGPGFELQTPNPHCLKRNIQTALADNVLQWKNDVMPVLAQGEFFNMSIAMDVPTTGKVRGLHGGGHSGVNGEMANVWSSINDPLFFLHHAMLDYIWWTWQNKAPQNLYAFNGPVYANGTGSVTLDYNIAMAPFIAPDVPVRKVMDSQNRDGNGILCVTYEGNGMPVPP